MLFRTDIIDRESLGITLLLVNPATTMAPCLLKDVGHISSPISQFSAIVPILLTVPGNQGGDGGIGAGHS